MLPGIIVGDGSHAHTIRREPFMKARQIVPNVHLIGAVDWDRRLFDSLIPLPQGTSYNAYFVQGSEKSALLDTVDPSFWETLAAQLDELPEPDYLVIQHTEQDHSGSTAKVLERYPDLEIVTNERCMKLTIDHLHVPQDRFKVVADGDTLSLGDKTLKFVLTPWVHWPETMSTWLAEDKVLFSCDFLGSHLATTDLFAGHAVVHGPAKRYYAEIMMPFAPQVAKNLDKIGELPIEIVAPSHGPLHDKPGQIIDAYREWSTGEPKNLVVIPWVTMHDSTRLMVDRLTDSLVQRDVAVERFDLSVVDPGELAQALVDAATIVIGTCTVLKGPHPLAAHAAFLTNALKPKAQCATVIGSYGWGGKTVEKLVDMLGDLKLELFEPVLCKGMPRDEDYAALDRLAQAIADEHEKIGAGAR
jgi:flavorubredoxin